MTGAVLTVAGNITLSGSSQLTVTNGGLTIPQQSDGQYSIHLSNSANLSLNNSSVVTTGTTEHLTVTLNANDTSTVNFINSTLNSSAGSWMLGNFNNQSQLTVNGSSNLPTEVYPGVTTADTPTLKLANSSFATLWIPFTTGSSDTVSVPKEDAQGNVTIAFPSSGATGFNYSVSVTECNTRLGFQSYPGSTMIVNGDGTGTGDAQIQFSIYVIGSMGPAITAPISINGLTVGPNINYTETDSGRTITLNNVCLNPVSWQVYVADNSKAYNGTADYPVTFSNSIINEAGTTTDGIMNISNSVLQYAQLGAFGPGSQLTITGTDIWSQQISAENGGQTTITNSTLRGNYIFLSGSGSTIAFSNDVDHKNGSLSAGCPIVNGYPPNTNGVPSCNFQNPLGQCAQVVPGSVGITGMPVPCS
jgi:hypothetical protein